MKNNIFHCRFIFFIIAISFHLQASSQSLEEMLSRNKEGVNVMIIQFGLSNQQAIQLEKLNVSYVIGMDSIENAKEKSLKKGENRKTFVKRREEELKQLFTKEQFEKYLDFIQKNRVTLPPDKPVDWEEIVRDSGKDPVIND